MNVLVSGSRDGFSKEMVFDFLDEVSGLPHINIDLIIHGGARGVDRFASEWARAEGLNQVVVKPDWGRHGKKAGMLRNIEMIEMCDVLVAMCHNNSKGTTQAIKEAHKRGKEVISLHTTGE